MECPICYEAITADTGIVTTSCKHSYHFSCIAGWYIKQEKGTCPCCRKEMNEKEDFPYAQDSESECEVEFTRRELQEFIEAHGGHLTEEMSDAICAVIGSFTHTELNSLLVGNTGQSLTEEEWQQLLERPDSETDNSYEEQVQIRIHIIGDERNVYLFPSTIYETAAIKIQSAWRTQRAAQTLITMGKN